MVKLTEKQLKNFWKKVKKINNCWVWIGRISSRGYGAHCLRINNKKYGDAHRISWVIHNGEIPKELLVCHKCDNRKCINPKHLFLGTPKDNVQDMIKKERGLVGEKNGSNKLYKDEVLKIRKLYIKNLFGYKKIAKIYNVNLTTIYRIIKREKWKHLK